MKKYILRFRGAGTKPDEDVSLIQSLPDTKVLDATGRMLLVEAPETKLAEALKDLPDWVMTEEVEIPLPDPRPKLRRRVTAAKDDKPKPV